jgi:iron(III) transport system substrate-binding protein
MTARIVKSVAALLLCFQAAAMAADPPKRTLTELANYRGADREAQLVQAAKQEGELSLYFSHPVVGSIAAAFEKKYGIKTKVWRASNDAIMQRVGAEAKAGRHEVDMLFGTTVDVEAASREKMLEPVQSPVQQDVIDRGIAADRSWAVFSLDVITTAYNTRLVKKEDLPKTWDELNDPKWKGKLAIEANNHLWYGQMLTEMGEERGRRLFGQIVSGNGISARKGNSLLMTMVASGEVPLALTVYSWNPEQLKVKGAPVEAHFLQPLIAQPAAVGVLRKAPNPAAAILFYDFLLTEGQKIMHDAGYVPASRKFDNPVKQFPLKMIDPVKALQQQDNWFKLFDQDIVKKAK